MSEIRLLSTDELLRDIVAEVTEIRIREHAVMQKIAELDRRGAASELGYKNLPQVLRHAVRWDPRTAKKWVEQAGLLDCALTPTGSEVAPALPVTATAVAEGALSIDHVAVVAEGRPPAWSRRATLVTASNSDRRPLTPQPLHAANSHAAKSPTANSRPQNSPPQNSREAEGKRRWRSRAEQTIRIGMAVMTGTQPTQRNHARMRLRLDFGCEVLAFPDQAGAKHPTFSA